MYNVIRENNVKILKKNKFLPEHFERHKFLQNNRFGLRRMKYIFIFILLFFFTAVLRRLIYRKIRDLNRIQDFCLCVR